MTATVRSDISFTLVEATGPPPRAATLQLSYVLPLATTDGEDVSELAAYLRSLAAKVADVIVVDGSAAAVRRRHRKAFGPEVRTLVPEDRTKNGKVGNVCTGIRAARFEHVVIADDDVRYRPEQLVELDRRLGEAAVVRPQNSFEPLPWHARVDTARTLLARATGGDWPGTLAVRRSAVLAAGGYRGDVLFENLELVRTVRAAGGREHVALDIVVPRLPPTTAHFGRQQVRQAYDELARPGRLAVSLAVLPAVAALARRRRWLLLAAAGGTVTAAAEAGRRRAGGRDHFSVGAVPLAPPWLVWRSICTWVALGSWLRGGAPYRGDRLRVAASSRREVRRLVEAAGRCRKGLPAPR